MLDGEGALLVRATQVQVRVAPGVELGRAACACPARMRPRPSWRDAPRARRARSGAAARAGTPEAGRPRRWRSHRCGSRIRSLCLRSATVRSSASRSAGRASRTDGAVMTWMSRSCRRQSAAQMPSKRPRTEAHDAIARSSRNVPTSKIVLLDEYPPCGFGREFVQDAKIRPYGSLAQAEPLVKAQIWRSEVDTDYLPEPSLVGHGVGSISMR